MGAVFTRYHAMSVYLHKLSPLNDELDRHYVNRIKSMTISMVRGTLVISLVQGTLTALFLSIAGVHYAAFFGLMATVASIIPLGSGVIALPIGILLIASGNVWQGILQIAGNLLVVTNVDNFLRPRLVSKEAALHPALVLLGLFAGLWHFGFLGAIYGPVIMIFIVTTIEIYQKRFSE
jgi:predicted PurR-regulated permease PerM